MEAEMIPIYMQNKMVGKLEAGAEVTMPELKISLEILEEKENELICRDYQGNRYIFEVKGIKAMRKN